jgi:hypothetical protein
MPRSTPDSSDPIRQRRIALVTRALNAGPRTPRSQLHPTKRFLQWLEDHRR